MAYSQILGAHVVHAAHKPRAVPTLAAYLQPVSMTHFKLALVFCNRNPWPGNTLHVS